VYVTFSLASGGRFTLTPKLWGCVGRFPAMLDINDITLKNVVIQSLHGVKRCK